MDSVPPPDPPKPPPVVHDFDECLERSHSYADAAWWMEVYRKAFPNLAAAVNVRGYGWAQQGGIDRVLTLYSGKTLDVDEKVREKDYGDILLERYSDMKRKTPGWMQKTLACDYIAYAIAPRKTCYLLPFQTLRRAWLENGQEWVRKYPRIEALNHGYITLSVGVPTDVLLRALTDAMTVHWKPT
jgi:hypothetical protein